MDEKMIADLKAKLAERVTADPKVEAPRIYGEIAYIGNFLKTLGLPPAHTADLLHEMLADDLAAFKAAVIEELLEQQKATNDALADALRGGRG